MTTVLLEDLGQDLAMMARLVQSQLVTAMTAFFQRDVALAEKLTEKDDHVDNLLGFIEEKCFERIAGEPADSLRSRRLRGVFRVALNLEKLGDYAVNLAEVITSFTDASADKAKHACHCEVELDRQYREALAEAFRRLREPSQDPAFIITHLFVAKFLERIGDSILNIGRS